MNSFMMYYRILYAIYTYICYSISSQFKRTPIVLFKEKNSIRIKSLKKFIDLKKSLKYNLVILYHKPMPSIIKREKKMSLSKLIIVEQPMYINLI